MLEQAFGRLLAVVALFALIGLVIVIGAIFLECASWGQCPEVTQILGRNAPEPGTPQ